MLFILRNSLIIHNIKTLAMITQCLLKKLIHSSPNIKLVQKLRPKIFRIIRSFIDVKKTFLYLFYYFWSYFLTCSYQHFISKFKLLIIMKQFAQYFRCDFLGWLLVHYHVYFVECLTFHNIVFEIFNNKQRYLYYDCLTFQ